MKLKIGAIRNNILANLFGVGVNLLNQIILVPIYILYWGTNLYADWLVLSSITIVFSMSDIGLNTVIQNKFSICTSQKRNEEGNALLSTNLIIVSFIFAISLGITGIFVSAVNIVETLGLHTINRHDANIIIFMIVIRVFITMYSQIENAIYRANHKNSRCVYIDQASTLLCVLATIICLYSRISMVYLCYILCIPPIIVILIKYFDTKKIYTYIFSIKYVKWRLFIGLIRPALAFLSFPIGNALILQGYTFIINKYYGADEVVSYNTTRTMCNFIITLLGTIQASVWPEYSIAYGERDYNRMRTLHSKAMTSTLLGSVLLSIFILAFGPIIFHIWTKGKVEFNYELMIVFILAILLKMLWTASGVTLMATNHHRTMGYIYVIGALASFGSAYYLASIGISIIVVALTIIFAHLTLDLYTIKAGIILTKDNFKSLMNRNVKFLCRKN